MAVLFVKLIFLAVVGLFSFVSRLILTTTPYLLVVIIQGLRLPGQAMQGALDQVAEAIKACFEFILGFVMEAINSLVSSAFDLLMETLNDSLSAAGTAVGDVIEMTRTSFYELVEELPGLADGFSEMISSMISDMLNHYRDAIGYVKGNA